MAPLSINISEIKAKYFVYLTITQILIQHPVAGTEKHLLNVKTSCNTLGKYVACKKKINMNLKSIFSTCLLIACINILKLLVVFQKTICVSFIIEIIIFVV